MRTEFQVHLLNSSGIAKAIQLGELFSEFLDHLEKIVPPGRERSLVVTKIQEASFFAKRGIALLPENQDAPPSADD
jgi:hypothetical protein